MSQLKIIDYFTCKDQGRLARYPRNGSLRILPSPGPSGRTVGTESLVLADYLLPGGSPNTSGPHWHGRGLSGPGSAQAQRDSPVVSPAPVLVGIYTIFVKPFL